MLYSKVARRNTLKNARNSLVYIIPQTIWGEEDALPDETKIKPLAFYAT